MLCLNLYSRRWLKPRRNLVISLIHFGLWQLQTPFGLGRMNFKILFLKKPTLSELRFLKKLCFVEVMLCFGVSCQISGI